MTYLMQSAIIQSFNQIRSEHKMLMMITSILFKSPTFFFLLFCPFLIFLLFWWLRVCIRHIRDHFLQSEYIPLMHWLLLLLLNLLTGGFCWFFVIYQWAVVVLQKLFDMLHRALCQKQECFCKPVIQWSACKPVIQSSVCKPVIQWSVCKPVIQLLVCKPVIQLSVCKPVSQWSACKPVIQLSVCKLII